MSQEAVLDAPVVTEEPQVTPVTDQLQEQETPALAAPVEPEPAAAPAEAPPFDINAWLKDNAEHPALKKIQADASNTAVQRARREAGRNEVVAQRLQEFAERLGVDTGELTKEQRAQFGFLSDANARHLSVEAMKGLAAITLENAPDQIKRVSGTIEQLADMAERSPEDFGEFTMRLFDTVQEARAVEKLANTKLADVPEGAQLHKDINTEVARRLAEEMKAADIEARKSTAPPSPPIGSGTNITGRPTPAEYANASSAQRAKWRAAGVEALT